MVSTDLATARRLRVSLADAHIAELDACRLNCDATEHGTSFLSRAWRQKAPVKLLVDLGLIEWGVKGPFRGSLVNTRISEMGRAVLALISADEMRRIREAERAAA